MTDVLKMSRKALTIGVVLTTILWSMMATVLVAPLKASAAGCTSGSLIKGSLAAVYYCGSDAKRYVFTNDKNYWTWYADFSGVMTISDADLASIQIGGNVTYRPGVKMIKIQTDPKVYAIAHGGVLRAIASEAVATALYGATWNKQIDDISDAFFTNYSVGTPINAATDYDKNAEMSGSQTINQDKGLGAGTTTSGVLSVSLASDNPSSATVPQGARGVAALKFNVSNMGATAATVDSVTIHRAGPGNASDIANVYLYEGETRLTTGRSVNSSTNDASFSGLNLMLNAGQTRTLWVSVDIDGDSAHPATGNVHQFGVTHAVSGTAEAAGQPLWGNNFTIAGATVGSLQIKRTGSISNPKLGETGVKVASFTIAAGSSEDVTLKRLTLYQAGNLTGANLTNLKLMQAGQVLSTATGFDTNLHATFAMPAGFPLTKGQQKTFDVVADVGGSARANDDLKLYVEEDSDLYGIGSTYGYGVKVDRDGGSLDTNGTDGYDGTNCSATGHTAGTDECSFSKVEAGQVTIAFSGPSSENVATNGKDVELLHFTLVSQANIEVRHLRLLLTDSGTTTGAAGLLGTSNIPNLTDVKVTNVKTGATWWGPSDVTGTDGAASDASQTLTFNDVWTLQAGQVYEFKVTTDIASNANAGDRITATLLQFNSSDMRNLDNNTFLTIPGDVVPTGDIAGNSQTIQTATLVASLGASPVSQSFVKGTSNVDFVGLNLKAGDSTDVNVTEVDTIGLIDENASAPPVTAGVDNGVNVSDDILSCRLMDGATQLGQARSPSVTTGVMNFTNLNVSITHGMTKPLKVNCDISNSAYRNGNSEGIAFTIVGVTAQDADGSTVAVSPSTGGTMNPINDGGAATTFVTVTTGGTMTYALQSDPETEASIVVAGQSGVVLGKLRLTAANEELKQTKLRISLVNPANYTNMVSMSLYDGATVVSGPVPVDSLGNADFSGMSFTVTKDNSKTLTVKGETKLTSDGATSGADLSIVADTFNPTAGTFEFRGTNSSTVNTLGAGTADIAAAQKILRKTKLTVSNAALPSTSLLNGDMVASRFTLTADGAGQASVKTLTFSLSVPAVATTPALANPTIRQTNLATIPATATMTGAACTAGNGTCVIKITFTDEQTVAIGDSKTFDLHVDTLGTATDDSLQTRLVNEAAGSSATTTGELGTITNPGDGIQAPANAAAVGYNFVWSDNSAVPHNDLIGGAGDTAASNDWENGMLIKVLPNDAQTLS